VRFLPLEYQPTNFTPSEHDVANARAEHPQHVARFRRDDSTGHLHSNTNILHWSDGSMTISIGGEQYELTKKPLAPPANKPYNALHDAHYYAATAELTSNMLMTVGHVTEQFNIRPNKEIGDDALNLFSDRMAKATKASGGADMIIRTTVDPELQKKHAEQLEKERMKAQRRRENAQAKQDVGLGRLGRGGLSIGALEGGRRDGGRKRGAPGAGKPKRHRPDYDSDDDLPHGVARQEKYDLDDGFLVGSDEEEMESDADDDDEDELDDEEDAAPRSKRQRTAEASEEDRDASADEVEVAHEVSARHRRRNVIDDDDD
jgi:RNA polymerase-associated protein LEO1